MRTLLLAALISLGALSTACSPKTGGSPLRPPSNGDAQASAGSDDAATPAGAIDGGATRSDAGRTHPRYTWWHDVRPIVMARCQLCHGDPPLYGAPRSLVSYADTQIIASTGDPVYKLMAFKIVARMDAMPPPDQPQLTADQKQIILDWVDEGAPEGDPPPDGGPAPRDGGVSPDSGPGPSNDAGTSTSAPGRVTLEFTTRQANSTMPYAIPVGATQYTCWAFSVPASITGRQHGIRFEPVVVNTMHLHHMLLFRNSQANAQAGPYDCTSWPYQYEMVAGWAPGRTAVDMPPGVGVPVNSGDQFVLQAHFNGVTTSDQVDQSGFRMVVVDTPNLVDAGILWAGVIFGSAINGPDVSKSGECTLSSPITIFGDFPHMHRTGTHITLDLMQSGAATYTNLVDVQPWSFDAQPNSPIPGGQMMLQSGDKLRTTCWWDTMGRSINYGEASSDEMCFNFIYHYPLTSNQFGCVTFSL